MSYNHVPKNIIVGYEGEDEPLSKWENAVVYAVSGICWVIICLAYPFYIVWRACKRARCY